MNLHFDTICFDRLFVEWEEGSLKGNTGFSKGSNKKSTSELAEIEL